MQDPKAFMPGPGSYQPEKTRSNPAFSIVGRIERPKPAATPGPGAYNVVR